MLKSNALYPNDGKAGLAILEEFPSELFRLGSFYRSKDRFLLGKFWALKNY